MKNHLCAGRRSFLASTTASAAFIFAGNTFKTVYAFNKTSSGTVQINDEIDNLRVICCHDTSMITGTPNSSFSSQNSCIDSDQVSRNLDLMAVKLSQKETADLAWQTIFRKPLSKTWDQVKCAIKVNCICRYNMPRIAIINKICQVLIAQGVSPSNIVIYDGGHNAKGNDKYTPYVGTGLPVGVIVSNKSDSLGGTTAVTLTEYPDSPTSCTTDILNGNVDIIVNCAVNKGHNTNAAGFTLCMKNHFGTFTPCCNLEGLSSSHRVPYTIAINKHTAIIGGTPPRQQLCIVDSLYASKDGPESRLDSMPAIIVMGVYAPAVDYLTVYKIRKGVMGVEPDNKVPELFSQFGYTEDVMKTIDLIYIDQTGSFTSDDSKQTLPQYVITLDFVSPRYKSRKLMIQLHDEHIDKTASIFDLHGNLIKTLNLPSNCRERNITVFWDGKDSSGQYISSGKYIFSLAGKKDKNSLLFDICSKI